MWRGCLFFVIITAIISAASAQNKPLIITGNTQNPPDTVPSMQQQMMAAFAAYKDEITRIKLSDTTYRWGTNERVTYHVPQTSIYASPLNRDTLFCIVTMRAFGSNPSLCIPMVRVSDTMRSCSFSIPDSTLQFSIKIYSLQEQITSKRVSTSFPCKTKEGKSLPTMSVGAGMDYMQELFNETQSYPTYYATYANWDENAEEGAVIGMNGVSRGTVKEQLFGVIRKLESQHEMSAGRYLVLSKLYSQIDGGDSASLANLHRAATMKTYDDAFDDEYFWERFHLDNEKAAIITPLVVRFPRSLMSQSWIKKMAFNPAPDTSAFNSIAAEWKDSHNTGILAVIGEAYSRQRSPMFDAQKAVYWLGKAEESVKSRSGFYSGEDVYDCQPDKVPEISYKLAYALAKAGYPDSAITLATNVYKIAKTKDDKINIQLALGFAYLMKGDTTNAKFSCGAACAFGEVPGNIGVLYNEFRAGDETKSEFAARMRDTYAKNIPDPYEFEYTTLDGTHGDLHALQGKVVFLDFWFIGCEGCELEKKSISDLADSYRNRNDIVFLSIALNDKHALAKYLSRVKYNVPVVPDAEGNISGIFSVEGYPTHIIIAKDGSIFGTFAGGSKNIGDILRPKIEKALTEK